MGLRVRPMPVVKDRLVGVLLISLLRSQIQAAITSLLSTALGRSLPVNKVAKVALRQGLLGGLTNNAAEQPCPPCPWPPARSNNKDDKLDHWRRHWLLSISVGNSSREALFINKE